MIEGLRKLLEKIEPWEEIKTIIPGRTNRSKSVRKLEIRIQYDTKDGVKCIAQSRASVQEVFIVTTNRDAFKQHFKELTESS